MFSAQQISIHNTVNPVSIAYDQQILSDKWREILSAFNKASEYWHEM